MVVFCYPSDCYSTVCTQHSACTHTPHCTHKFYFFLKFCSTSPAAQVCKFFLILACKNGALLNLDFFAYCCLKNGALCAQMPHVLHAKKTHTNCALVCANLLLRFTLKT